MMNETDHSIGHSYYPSARHMIANDKSGTLRIQRKLRMELVISHNQVLDSGSSRKIQQQPQLQSIRCTTCTDTNGNTVFYRPYIAVHTLFQNSSQGQGERRRSMDGAATTSQQSLFNTEKDTSHAQNMEIDGATTMITTSIKGDGNNSDDDDDSNTINNDTVDNRVDRKHGSLAADDIKDYDNTLESNYSDDLDQRWVVPKQHQIYVTLYNATDDSPSWSLIEQDAHTMTLRSHQLPHKYASMTTGTFSFVWEEDRTGQHQEPVPFLFPYQWQMQLAEDGTSMELLCEQYQPYQATKKPIALLDKQGTRLILFGNDDESSIFGGGGGSGSMNPFRTIQQDVNNIDRHLNPRKIDSLDTFLVLSGLLLDDLIGSQLCALVSSGRTEAMVMMIERQQQALKEEDALFYKQYQYYIQQQQQLQMSAELLMEVGDDGLNTIHMDAPPPIQYYSKQGLVSGSGGGDDMSSLDQNGMGQNHRGDNNTRWSSSTSGSLKSLELDPGLWRCWWGNGCWWQWLPCCMPGGCCDRAYINICGLRRQHHHHHHHRSRVTRRMQGWQQQQE